MPQIERGHISEITPHDKNTNKGTVRGRGVIEQSVQKHGAGRSLLLDRNKKAIAGNHAAEVLGAAGIEDVVYVHTTGREIVAVVRDDLDLDDPDDPSARSLAVYDNRASELGLSYDAAQLLAVMQESDDVNALFSPAEAAHLLQTSEGQGKQYQIIPLLFSPDELADIKAALDDIAKGAHAAQPEWWIARYGEYDRLMNGLGEVMKDKKNLRYVHQAFVFLVKHYKRTKHLIAGEEVTA